MVYKIHFQIIDDDSGLGGFGAEIDFTDNKLIKDRVNVKCMNQCFEWINL